jgi:hypothetical protein
MPKQPPKSFEAEVRDTIVKSGLTGVAATVLAVTVFSPAGLGGMVGTSLASGFGLDTGASAADDNVYASLPAYPSPLTPQELSDIRSKLARTAASLEITRAATEAKIEHIRTLSLAEGVAGFAPMPREASAPELRLALDEPAVVAPTPAAATPRDANLELAELMFAHENF